MLEQCELKISKLLSLTAPLEDVSDRQRRMDDAHSVPVQCDSEDTSDWSLLHVSRRMKSTRRS